MSKKSIEEILAGAARGEPMDIDERDRLIAALDRSAWLRAMRGEQEQLTAELAGLRRVLRTLRDPGDREDTLRNAFGEQLASRRVPRRSVARAAVAGFALAAVALLVVGRIEQGADDPRPDPLVAEPAPAAVASRVDTAGRDAIRDLGVGVIGAFQPLMYGPGFSPAASYSVVRVRMPASALALSYVSDGRGVVEADILIGEDGLPTAIRFAPTEALASTSEQYAQ